MIHANELAGYTPLEHKLEKFFKKLDNKVRKKSVNNGRRLSVLVYDEFVPDLNIFPHVQQQAFHKEVYDDLVVKDPEIFHANNRSQFIFAVQHRLVHDYGYSNVSWNDFNHKSVSNAMQLTFNW